MTDDTNGHDVLELVERWAAAERHNDARLLEELLAPDVVGVGPLQVPPSR
jgi:hypothetical protein